MSDESDLLKTLSSLLASDDNTHEEPKEEPNDALPFDLDTIMKLGSVFSDLNSEDNRAKLLRDLKPFLSSEKRDKIEQTIKILKLLKIVEKVKNENLL